MREIKVYENNSMSMSCEGLIVIDSNNIIKDIRYSGQPRPVDQHWFNIFKDARRGEKLTQSKINLLLTFDGCHNLKVKQKTV